MLNERHTLGDADLKLRFAHLFCRFKQKSQTAEILFKNTVQGIFQLFCQNITSRLLPLLACSAISQDLLPQFQFPSLSPFLLITFPSRNLLTSVLSESSTGLRSFAVIWLKMFLLIAVLNSLSYSQYWMYAPQTKEASSLPLACRALWEFQLLNCPIIVVSWILTLLQNSRNIAPT